jgi:ATP-dependent Clp endopeptidase proteolytic subunit ClpP
MELKFSKIVSRANKTVEMLLYGELGDDVQKGEINGHYFARELQWLAREYDVIKIRVNSNGGDVGYGLSIVSEMMASQAFIVVQVDGVAASMAATLLPAGDKVLMNDYAKLMIHSPYYEDQNGDKVKNLSAKAKKSLAALKDIIKQLLTKRGLSEEEVLSALATDTWYSAEEALKSGLIDEVITTGKKELAALEPSRLVAKINESQNSKSMKKVIAKLNELGVQLAEDANEDQVVASLNSLPKGEENQLSDKVVDKLIAIGKVTGVVTEGEDGNEQAFRELAVAKTDLFLDLLKVDQLKATETPKGPKGPKARMSDLVAEAKDKAKGKAGDGEEKTFGWYERHNPTALAKMEQLEPEKFAALKAADDALYE